MVYILSTLIPLLLSTGIHYLISRKKKLSVTLLVKIVVGFYIATSVLNISIDLSMLHENNWPDPMPDYRLRELINNAVIFFVFITPIILRSAKFLIFSFCYILVNQVLFFLFAMLMDVISGEGLLVGVLKFGVVLFVFIRALESSPRDNDLVETY